MPIPRTWLALLLPPAEMVDLMSASIPPAFRIFIGVAEVLAAVGLTLPGITRVLPRLIPWQPRADDRDDRCDRSSRNTR
jgi:hypothetical protein